MLNISAAALGREESRSLLTRIVAPRPIAWISTVSSSGVRNLAPFSSVAPVCNRPPMISLSCGRKSDGTRKDTAVNILATGQFVLNFVGSELANSLEISSGEFPAAVDEFTLIDVTPVPSKLVRPPTVAEALASLECTLHHLISLGEGDAKVDLIIGEVRHFRISDPRLAEGGVTEVDHCQHLAALGVGLYMLGGAVSSLPAARSTEA